MSRSKPEISQNILITSLVKHKWLTPFELVCLLTTFPENFKKIEVAHHTKPFVILPSQSFDLKKCDLNFKKIFKIINEDLRDGKLLSKPFSVGDIRLLIKSLDGLVWAIQKKIPWPISLQKALSVKFKQKKQLNPWIGKINIMVLTQYCTLLTGKTAPIEIIRDPMMRTYIPKAKEERLHRQIQKEIAKVSEKKEQGWQNIKSPQQAEIQPLNVISDVLENHGDQFKCDFHLLKGVIWTAAFIKTHHVLNQDMVCRMTLMEFMHEMLEDQMISLYVKNSSSFIAYYIKAEIKNFYDLLPEFFGSSLVRQYNNVFLNKNGMEFDEDNIGE